MPRVSSSTEMSLAQLEKLMNSRRKDLAKLTRQRQKVQKKLDAIDEKIAAIGGSAGGGRRARNAMSLQDLIHQVLSKANGAMSVGDILNKVNAAGYRSNSANFRGIINQTLIKDKRFVAAKRGMYQLK